MKKYSKETLESYRPPDFSKSVGYCLEQLSEASELTGLFRGVKAMVSPSLMVRIDRCLEELYQDDTHTIDDLVCPGLTFEEVIGALLASRDRLELLMIPLSDLKPGQKAVLEIGGVDHTIQRLKRHKALIKFLDGPDARSVLNIKCFRPDAEVLIVENDL